MFKSVYITYKGSGGIVQTKFNFNKIKKWLSWPPFCILAKNENDINELSQDVPTFIEI